MPLKIMLEGFFCDFHSALHQRHVNHSGSFLQYQISATRGHLFDPLGGAGWQYLTKVYIENINTPWWRWDGGGVCSY